MRRLPPGGSSTLSVETAPPRMPVCLFSTARPGSSPFRIGTSGRTGRCPLSCPAPPCAAACAPAAVPSVVDSAPPGAPRLSCGSLPAASGRAARRVLCSPAAHETEVGTFSAMQAPAIVPAGVSERRSLAFRQASVQRCGRRFRMARAIAGSASPFAQGPVAVRPAHPPSVEGARNPGATPSELLALLLFAAPDVFTLQKLLLLLAFGERSQALTASRPQHDRALIQRHTHTLMTSFSFPAPNTGACRCRPQPPASYAAPRSRRLHPFPSGAAFSAPPRRSA